MYCAHNTVCVVDIRRLNSKAVFAKRTGMIILGGGLVKHHIANANLMVSNYYYYDYKMFSMIIFLNYNVGVNDELFNSPIFLSFCSVATHQLES